MNVRWRAPSRFGCARVLTAGVLSLAVCGGQLANASGQNEAAPGTKPAVIYVTDFELEPKNVDVEKNPLPRPPRPPFAPVLPKPPGEPADSATRARELVDLMATSLVGNLRKAGLGAQRLRPAEPWPASGWLVRGIFTQVDEGNRLRRAVVGFGAGQTRMQVAAAVDDLARGAPNKFYDLKTSAESGKMPGAGPLVMFTPAAVAVRFALAGGDLERNVEQAAARIAADVVARVRK